MGSSWSAFLCYVTSKEIWIHFRLLQTIYYLLNFRSMNIWKHQEQIMHYDCLAGLPSFIESSAKDCTPWDQFAYWDASRAILDQISCCRPCNSYTPLSLLNITTIFRQICWPLHLIFFQRSRQSNWNLNFDACTRILDSLRQVRPWTSFKFIEIFP